MCSNKQLRPTGSMLQYRQWSRFVWSSISFFRWFCPLLLVLVELIWVWSGWTRNFLSHNVIVSRMLHASATTAQPLPLKEVSRSALIVYDWLVASLKISLYYKKPLCQNLTLLIINRLFQTKLYGCTHMVQIVSAFDTHLPNRIFTKDFLFRLLGNWYIYSIGLAD